MGSERVAYKLSVTWYRSEHPTWLCCDKKIWPKTGCQKLGLVVHNGLKRQKKITQMHINALNKLSPN